MKSNRKIDVKKWIIHYGIPLGVGGLSAFLCRNDFSVYKEIVQPPLAPPAWLFGVVWSILYLLMGYSTYTLSKAEVSLKKKRQAYIFYGIQLFLNFWWSPAFFILQNFMLAFVILVVMYFFIWQTIDYFRELSYKAGSALIPYAVWSTFALYLNLAIVILNH